MPGPELHSPTGTAYVSQAVLHSSPGSTTVCHTHTENPPSIALYTRMVYGPDPGTGTVWLLPVAQ